MKLLKIFLIIAFGYHTIVLCGCNNQAFMSKEISNNENCLTKDQFNLVKDCVLENGIQIKLSQTGIITDTTTLSKQIFLNGKTIALIEINNNNRIIVIDKLNDNKIPVYFVSNESAPCLISAYYSMLDTDESIKTRNDDWCKIVTEIINNKESFDFIDKETALKIAEKDAKTAYRDLSIYNVRAELKEETWFVDYDLSNPEMVGGGPHYVICAKSGTILTRRYEQ